MGDLRTPDLLTSIRRTSVLLPCIQGPQILQPTTMCRCGSPLRTKSTTRYVWTLSLVPCNDVGPSEPQVYFYV